MVVISIDIVDTDENTDPDQVFTFYHSKTHLYYYCIPRNEEVFLQFSVHPKSVIELPGFLFLTIKDFAREQDCREKHQKACLSHGSNGDAVFARRHEGSVVNNFCISHTGRGDIHVTGDDLSRLPITFVRITSREPSKCSCRLRLLIEGNLAGHKINAEILVCLLL